MDYSMPVGLGVRKQSQDYLLVYKDPIRLRH